MINSVIACLFLFLFGAVLFVVNATAPSSKVLFHFHELCRLRLRKTRKGDLPGPGGEEEAVGAPPAGRAGGVIWPEGVVLPDEGTR